jgi:hypothetical protein
MAVYEVQIIKKFNNIKLYRIKKSVKGEQNQISKIVSSLVDKYVLKKKPGEGTL